MSTVFLTEKQLEYLMTGTNVRIDGTLAFPVLICPPSDVRDSCHVSYSLHRTIVGRLEARIADLAAKVLGAGKSARNDSTDGYLEC